MKSKNKKLMTALVAVFMLVFVSGSAFALMSSGPLVFNGVANIDATLELLIVESDITHNAVRATVTPDNSNIGRGVKYIEFEVDFDQPGQYALFDFWYENVGTVPAQIDFATLTEGGTGTALSGLNGNMKAEVGNLWPGDRKHVVFNINFDINPSFTGNHVSGSRTWVLEIHYSPLAYKKFSDSATVWEYTFSE